MKKFLWIIAITINLVQVKCESIGNLSPQTYSNSLLYYQNVPQQQLQYTSGFSGLGTQQSFNTQYDQGFSNGYYSQQQFGLPLPYQGVPQFQRQLGYQQNYYQPIQYQQQPLQFTSFSTAGNPIGGRSAYRSGRLQHLYTKAIASNSPTGAFVIQNAKTFTPSKVDTHLEAISTPVLNLPIPSFLQKPGKLLTPTNNNYFTPTPKPITPFQISSTLSSAPALPVVPTAPPLPPVPSIKNFNIFSKDGTFSMASSIPFAEGHSVGNNIAYTYNAGFGAGLSTVAPPLSHSTASNFAPSLVTNYNNYQDSSALGSFQSSGGLNGFDANSYSFEGLGYGDNRGIHYSASYGDSYGDDFAKLFNNVYKRESKTRPFPVRPFLSNNSKKKATSA